MSFFLKNVVLLLLLFALLIGCSTSKEKEIPAYFSARILPALKVPPDLDKPYRAQAMQLPEAAFNLVLPVDTDAEELLKPPRVIDDTES